MEMVKVHTGCSRLIMAVLSALGLLGAGAVWSVAAAPPAAAAVECVTGKYWTSWDPAESDVFQVPSGSDCADLNAAFTYTEEDKIQGWYLSSSGWEAGSAGFVFVPRTDTGWRVLLTSVRDGANVRGESMKTLQHVQYVI
jgi:hypothetical protein